MKNPFFYKLLLVLIYSIVTLSLFNCKDSAKQESTYVTGVDTTTELKHEPVSKQIKSKKSMSASSMIANFKVISVRGAIHGKSTIHNWESQITKIQCKGKFRTNDHTPQEFKDVVVKIPVKGIQGLEGKKMDEKTYETFKSDKYPNIVYTFSNADVTIKDKNDVLIETTGKLFIAGTTKEVPISAKGVVLKNGDLKVSVNKQLKISDFNMERPTMALGTIKVADDITVSMDLVLAKVK